MLVLHMTLFSWSLDWWFFSMQRMLFETSQNSVRTSAAVTTDIPAHTATFEATKEGLTAPEGLHHIQRILTLKVRDC